MTRFIACAVLVLVYVGAAQSCDQPASGEGFYYVVRCAAFVYDFSQDPPMAYGDIDIQVTHDEPIVQMCVICDKKAADDQLRYAVVARDKDIQPQRRDTLGLHGAEVAAKGKSTEFIMPFDEEPPEGHVTVYMQVPVADLTPVSVVGGRLKTTAPRFMVPCDMMAVRLIPPKGRVFVPDEIAAPNVDNAGPYRLRGQLRQSDMADASISHALYVNHLEGVKLPDGGYYFNSVEPLESILIAGQLKSIRATQARRLLLIVAVIVAGGAAVSIVWLLASASAHHTAQGEQKDIPT
jgi:hypothetical protein